MASAAAVRFTSAALEVATVAASRVSYIKLTCFFFAVVDVVELATAAASVSSVMVHSSRVHVAIKIVGVTVRAPACIWAEKKQK